MLNRKARALFGNFGLTELKLLLLGVQSVKNVLSEASPPDEKLVILNLLETNLNDALKYHC